MFFCAQTWVMEGELPFSDMLGIVVGHLYHYLSKKKGLKPPSFIRNLFASPNLKKRYGVFKDDFHV